MQIKAGFKKEWFQFSRTFRLWGILIATVSFSLADPLMYWAMNALLGSLTDTDMYGSIGGAVDIENSLGMLFGNAGSVFAGTMADLCATSLLIIMLILMSPCGGEQKKRATIIPSCSGLDTFSYLIPKYVMFATCCSRTEKSAAEWCCWRRSCVRCTWRSLRRYTCR